MDSCLMSAPHIGYHETELQLPPSLKHSRHQLVIAELATWSLLQNNTDWRSPANDIRRADLVLSTYYENRLVALKTSQERVVDHQRTRVCMAPSSGTDHHCFVDIVMQLHYTQHKWLNEISSQAFPSSEWIYNPKSHTPEDSNTVLRLLLSIMLAS